MITRTMGFLILSFACLSSAQTYTVTDLGVLSGDTVSTGLAINSSGQIVGCSNADTYYYYCNENYPAHAFLWESNSGMQDLGTLFGDPFSVGTGVNDSGEVVGYSANAQNVSHAFAWTAKTGMIALPTPAGTTSFANAINAAGVIAGSWGDEAVLWTPTGKVYHLGTSEAVGINSHNEVTGTSWGQTSTGFVWTERKGMQVLPNLVYRGESNASAINDLGVVVGWSLTSTRSTHAVLWTPSGAIRDVGSLGGTFGAATGINNLNQVVGSSTTSYDQMRAFIWLPGHLIQDLNNLIPQGGWLLQGASAINDAGEITGWGMVYGEQHAYLLTPSAADH